MTEVQFSGLKGGTIALSTDILTALRPQLRGSLCLPDEAGYDEARTIWNAMIDRRPGAVVRCRGASDVMRAVCLARDNGLLVALHSDFDGLGRAFRLARAGVSNQRGPRCCEASLVAL
jgi:hypothetical protein